MWEMIEEWMIDKLRKCKQVLWVTTNQYSAQTAWNRENGPSPLLSNVIVIMIKTYKYW